MKDVSMPQTLVYKNSRSSTTAEDLSKRWGLIIYQSALTLKTMAQ